MTVPQKVQTLFGPLMVAAFAGVLCGYLLNPSSVTGQGGPPTGVGKPVVKPGLAHRLAALEDRVDKLEQENKELRRCCEELKRRVSFLEKCVKELKSQVAELQKWVADLWLAIEECCGDQPVGCEVDADCDDGNPCTRDFCNPDTGECRHLPVVNDTPCGDGNVCVAGECVAP